MKEKYFCPGARWEETGVSNFFFFLVAISDSFWKAYSGSSYSVRT